MKDDLDRSTKRRRRYYINDGITELTLGGFMLPGGLSLIFIPNPFLVGLVFIICMLTVTRFTGMLRNRLVSTRKDHETYQEHSGWGMWTTLGKVFAILIAALGFFIIAFLFQPSNWLAWLPTIVGVFLAVILLFQGFNLGIIRLVVLGILSLLLGIALSPIILGIEPSIGYYGLYSLATYMVMMGIAFLITGGLALWIYLQRTKIPNVNAVLINRRKEDRQ